MREIILSIHQWQVWRHNNMDEQNYQKRELDHYFSELKDHLSKQDRTLERVEAQTMKTNGRVTKLEWNDKVFMWVVGALWTLIVLIVPVCYMIVKYIFINEINVTIDNKLKTYHPVVQINENN